MIILVGLVAAGLFVAILELQHQNITSGLNATQATSPAPVAVPANAVVGQTMVGSTAVDAVATQAAGSALSSIPVVGGIASSILGSFMAASQLRAKQATNENSAVDNFITKGFDPGIAQVVNAYNAGQITGAQAVTLLDQLWRNYWAEVSPQIQPGRNGCNSGAGIDYSPMHPPTLSVAQSCSGSWGAACCIGVQVIGSSIGRLQQTIMAVEASGGSRTCGISPVSPSKYSTFSRPAWRVTVQKPA